MASRNPDDLCPAIRPKYDAFMAKCHAEGLDVFNTCTYRSNAEQAELVKLKKTKAEPGKSKHNYMINGKPAAQAFDTALLVHGKLMWDDTPEGKALWLRIGAIGEECGLKWSGRWKKFKERNHFEI